MRKFVTYVTNGEYSIGCTGQTVYLFDKNNIELAKFRDLKYAYYAVFSPNGNMFAVRSNEGRLAIYDLAERRLMLKFRYAKGKDGEQPQDANACFSPDGERFYIIAYRADLCSSLLIYRTSDFSLEKRLFDDGNMVLDYIEYDAETEKYYLLGFFRNTPHGNNSYFVGRLDGDFLADIVYISESEYEFYQQYKDFEATGFTSWPAFAIPYDIDNFKDYKHTLAKLWSYYYNN